MNERREMLFIGGPLDGQRKVVEPTWQHRVYTMPQLGQRRSLYDTIQVTTYRISRFAEGDEDDRHEYLVYVHEDMKQPLKALLDAYERTP